MVVTGGTFDTASSGGLDYRCWYADADPQWHKYASVLEPNKLFTAEEVSGDEVELCIRIMQVNYRRRVFVGENGYCGLTSDDLHEGDLVCVFFGCYFPVILRPVASGRFIFIGKAYVKDLMEGEAIQALEMKELTCSTFNLI